MNTPLFCSRGRFAAALFFLVAALTLSAPAQNVVINEVLSSNQTSLMDEDGDHSDWIELVNRESFAVNLSGWHISDDPDTPAKWTFGDLTIPAGGRLLVWASGKDRVGDASSAVEATSPDQISGLVAWFKADAETFVNNATVTTWTDRSGLGNNVTQATTSLRPTFVTSAINGKPAIRFADTSGGQFLGFSTASFSGMSDLSNFTLLAASRWTGSGGMFGAFDRTGNSGSTHFEINSSGQLRLRVAALDTLRVDNAVTQNQWTILGASMSSTGDSPFASVSVNGQTIGTAYGSSGESTLLNYGTMGIGRSFGDRPYGGDVAEFVLFNRPLTNSERLGVAKYLEAKYAIPLALESSAPHTNFSINADGETIVLTRPDTSVADSVPVPALPSDVSYGRNPDATGAFAYFYPSSPKAENSGTAYDPPLARPTASQQRGFFTSPFAVTLSHADSNASIYYTTNGDDPTPTSGTLYTGPLNIAQTTVLRAAAYKGNSLPVQNILTETYLFLSDVITRQGTPAGYPTNWGGFSYVSYGLSPSVISSTGYAASITESLTSIPTLSLVIPMANMFSSTGVYASPTTDDFERAVSAEWIQPSGIGSFQIDAGLRVQGGASREFSNTPKKSLRLLFKSIYGPGRLEVPIFKDQGTSAADFNSVILRGEYNNSWVHWDSTQRSRGFYVRDKWIRDTQLAMSGVGARSNHVHLFINGIYWGLYNPSERPDAAFAATYFGGEREDYDAMTHSGIRDGDRVAWDAMMTIARSDMTQNANYEAIQQYLDIDEFIDYMILNLYGGNWDWPDNNWNATRRRATGAGYKFFAWDAERTLEGVNDNRTTVSGTDSPGELYARLRQNAEFRLRFADRARIHLFGNGALTPTVAIARMQALANAIEPAIYGEQARWGGYRREIYDRNGPSPIYTRDTHWQAEKTRLLSSYFPQRTGIFLSQLQNIGLYPATVSPSLTPDGGEYTAGTTVQLTAPAGTVYYTVDGSDPRTYGTGAVSASAAVATSPVTLTEPTTIKARALSGGVWSALASATFKASDLVHEFIPDGSADWTIDTNWNPSPYPNAAGVRARIPAPATGNREVTLRSAATVGMLFFESGTTTFRDRIRDTSAGSILTFDGDDETALLRVNGTGTGFVEFEFASQIRLSTDLRLEVNNTAGSSEHGALRLRTRWTGPGGLIKAGPGVASLTGEDKDYSGDTIIEQGTLQVTGPSVMANSAVTVKSGGQLRLISAGTTVDPRIHTFGGPITLAGSGRSGVPDASGNGVSGALRYDPSGTSNRGIVTNPVSMSAATSIHVEGTTNRLELNGPLLGVFGFQKTGGGTLAINGESADYQGSITVGNGRLEINGLTDSLVTLGAGSRLSGYGKLNAASGSGTVEADGRTLRLSTLTAETLDLVFATAGWPSFVAPQASGNGTLVVADTAGLGATVTARRINLFIAAPSLTDSSVYRGGVFTRTSAGLRATLQASDIHLFRQDDAGTVTVGTTRYQEISSTDTQITTVPRTVQLSDGSTFAGEMIEIRVGGSPVLFSTWAASVFTNPDDLANPAVSGKDAAPFGDGISNLVRYALDLPADTSAASLLPIPASDGAHHGIKFRFDPGKRDIAYVVEASSELGDWSRVIFDSRTSDVTSWSPGEAFTALDPLSLTRQFYRLRIIPLE